MAHSEAYEGRDIGEELDALDMDDEIDDDLLREIAFDMGMIFDDE